ncbi:MAG: hypothetical protein HQK83_11020 [Fibrobacteria bacterium]|nr:hypothetical protein [Fibrobacteria bacterium]
MDYLLKHKTLLQIFKRLGLKHPSQRLIIFAFRSFVPKGVCKAWQAQCSIKPAKLNYTHMRCTVGIWDQERGRIFIAPGSTVPHKTQAESSALKNGKGANQLEPGFYQDYQKGFHLEGSARGHQALRQTKPQFIRRTEIGIPYTTHDRLLFSNPHDNLHCAWNLSPDTPGFSSAGCIVVAGQPHLPSEASSGPNRGHWKTFHEYLYQTKQNRFDLLLLDAPLLKGLLIQNAHRPLVCYGSKGKAVKEIQKKLIALECYSGPVNSHMDTRCYRAWNTSGFIT